MKRNTIFSMLLGLMMLIVAAGCKKSYYTDTGTINPKYNGTMLQYLQNNKYHMFDSLSRMIKLAGLETVFTTDSLTFFAPADTSIKNSMLVLNSVLRAQGRDTVYSLSQFTPDFLKDQLGQYMFKGLHRLKDYPQIDPNNFRVYGGQYYASYYGKVMLIGVFFYDAAGVKYAGYRQLTITPNPPAATYAPKLYYVASSDVNPSNGIVHVLDFTSANYFGIDVNLFINGALSGGIAAKGQ
ncbi:MAG: hypothetical protein J7539_07625 [Niabella sp.]|nr:hypothetical protein [Niabella sp.]